MSREDNLKKFIIAIHQKRKIKVEFIAKSDRIIKTRKCAPYDYGKFKTGFDDYERFHIWDYDSYGGSHYLALLPEQILKIEILDETFDPEEIINWEFVPNRWYIKRDWEKFS